MHKGPAPLEQQGEGGSYRAGRATRAKERAARASSCWCPGQEVRRTPPRAPPHSCCSTAAAQRPGLCSQQHKNTEPSRQGPFRGYSPEKNRELKIKGPTGKAAQPCRTQPRGSVPQHSGEGARAARCTVLCPHGFEWFHHCLHISFVVLVCSHRCFAMMGWGQVQDFPALSLGNHQLMRFC